MARSKDRTITSGALVVLLVAALLVAPLGDSAIAGQHCTDVVLVLDESGSIADNETVVRAAVDDFLDGISDSGASVAIIEFGTSSSVIFGFTPATKANHDALFTPYLYSSVGGASYDSPSQTGPYTNWDDALDDVSLLDTTEHPDPLVLFLTDGDPTAYNLDHAGESGGIFSNAPTATALARAVEEADEVKGQGSQLVAVGVGSALTSDASVARLEAVSGTRRFEGTGTLDLADTDLVLIPFFSDLPSVMALIAEALCAEPQIEISKDVDAPVTIAGTEVTYTIQVTNTGNVALHDVVVTDPSVPDCTTTIGTLEVEQSARFECSTVLWFPLTNVARADGTDAFGTTVSDEDSAAVTLLATGTGTPGYWKNHRDAWPVFGGDVLIGDWDHDGSCSGGETCLVLSTDEAATALAEPARGDTTWILGRALVAAWLNVSAGNDATCIAGTIDAAIVWLLDHPLGSGLSGGDDAWIEGGDLAGTLDAYNNGGLCSEHRDADGDEAASDPPEQSGPAPGTTTTTTTFPGKGRAKGRDK